MSDLLSIKVNQTTFGERASEGMTTETIQSRKWPVWVRLIIIFGISAGLWTLIISVALMLLG